MKTIAPPATRQQLLDRIDTMHDELVRLRAIKPRTPDLKRRIEAEQAAVDELVERVQRETRQRLDVAMAAAVEHGLVIPCQNYPAEFTGEEARDYAFLCHGCPVRRECAAYATTGHVQWGVLAGQVLNAGRWKHLRVRDDDELGDVPRRVWGVAS